MPERWRVIPGFNGDYEISTEARVRSWVPRGGVGRRETPILMHPHKNRHNGTLFVRLGRKGHKKLVKVRDLMRDVWMRGKVPGMVVYHKNLDKFDCALHNLGYATREWVSRRSGTNRRAVVRLENGVATEIYASVTAAAKAEHLSPSGVVRRIKNKVVVDGMQLVYENRRDAP